MEKREKWCPLTGSLAEADGERERLINHARQVWRERWGLGADMLIRARTIYEKYLAWRQQPDPHFDVKRKGFDKDIIAALNAVKILKLTDDMDRVVEVVANDPGSRNIERGKIAKFALGMATIARTIAATDIDKRLTAIEASVDVETVAQVFSLLAIYEAREADNYPQASLLLSIVTDRYGRDALRGKKQKEDAQRGWQMAGEQRRKERETVWGRWQAEAEKIWSKHPDWSKRAVAIEIRKTDSNSPAVTTITPRIKK